MAFILVSESENRFICGGQRVRATGYKLSLVQNVEGRSGQWSNIINNDIVK